MGERVPSGDNGGAVAVAMAMQEEAGPAEPRPVPPSTIDRALKAQCDAFNLLREVREEHRKQTAVCAERWTRILELEAEVRAQARTITELMGRLEVDKERTGTMTMTAEEVQALREKIKVVREKYPNIHSGKVSSLVGKAEYDCLNALESLLPAPPEPRWPEGMEAWIDGKNIDDEDEYIFLCTAPSYIGIRIYLKDISPEQAERIKKLLRHAERLETAMFKWAEFISPPMHHESRDLYNAIAAYRAEEGEV